jgi:type I restriction enzyme S subunit
MTIIPDNWNIIPIKKVAEVFTGKTPPTADSDNYGDYIPFITPADIGKSKYITTAEKHLSKKGANSSKILPVGTSLFTCIGSTIGKVGVVATESVTNQQSNAVISNSKIDSDFLFYILNHIAPKIKRIAGVQAVPIINKTEFENTKILIPINVNEQRAIADILSIWDRAIEKMEKLIEVKEKYFDWLISELIHHNDFIKVKIKEIANEVSVRNNKNQSNQVLSVTNHSGFVLPEEQFSKKVASDNLENYKVVTNGQYAYNPSRINVGSIARLDRWDIGVLSPMYTVFKLNTNLIDSDYFNYWLVTHEARQRIKNSAQGSVRETVGFNDFCSIVIPLPKTNIQKEISSKIKLIRNEIDVLKDIRVKRIEQKRGLMQKLLTGEWRVKV